MNFKTSRSLRRRLVPLSLVFLMETLFLYALAGGICKSRAGDFSHFLLLMLLLFLPLLIFRVPAGWLADRFPKRYILMAASFGNLLCLTLFRESVNPYVLLFMAGIPAAFFKASLFSILPETFREGELSRANGVLGLVQFFGAVLGIGLSACPLLTFDSACDSGILMLAVFGGLSFLFSIAVVPVVSAVQRKKELRYRFAAAPLLAWRALCSRRSILMAALCDNLFLSLGFLLEILLLPFCEHILNDGCMNGNGILVLQLSPVLGMAIGSLWAGFCSKDKIELGLVPFGTAGVAIFLLFAAQMPGGGHDFSMAIPSLFSLSLHVHIACCIWLFCAGISGGLVVVPLRAYLQQRLAPEQRGSALALNLAFCFVLMGCGALLLTGLLRCFSASTLIVWLGLVAVAVTILAMWSLPDFALRFFIITLGNSLYRIKVYGREHIPERGGALLVSNHVSLIDSVLISACTSRRVRFLIEEAYFQRPLVRFLARLTGFVRVPPPGRFKQMALMRDTVREALAKGEIICVFPEGRITENGVMRRFKNGFQKLLPEAGGIPMIPVAIGNAWGGIFSAFYGAVRMRLPRSAPFFNTVTFGEPFGPGESAFDVRQRISEIAAETAGDVYPREHVFHYQVLKNLKRTPFRVLLHDFEGESFTLFRVFHNALLLSRHVRAVSDSDTRYVGVLLPNSCAQAISILGVMLADKTPVPLNPSTSQEVFDCSVRKASIGHIITSRAFAEKLRVRPNVELIYYEDLMRAVPTWKRIWYALAIFLVPYKELMNMVSPLTNNDPYGVAALLFSSGSTGVPKGVMLTHHNLFTDVDATVQLLKVTTADHIVGNLPLFHSFGLNVCFFMPMTVGCEVSYVPSPLDAARIGALLEISRPSILFSTPSFLQTYMRKCKPEQFDSLRLVFTGAEKLRSDIAERYQVIRHGERQVVELYGCTELSPVVTANLPEKAADLGIRPGKFDSIGVPLNNIVARVVDPLTFEPVPPNSEGLLFVKGPIVMKGYLGDDALTRKAILNGYYNTGDVAKMDEAGYVTICGRLSRFSKIAGEMVPHEMVERIINELCATDARVIAVGSIPDPTKGEALLVLYTPECPLSPTQIVDLLRERSISNLWIPKAANFHPVDRLPLLGSGKLDLSLLRTVAEEIATQRKTP